MEAEFSGNEHLILILIKLAGSQGFCAHKCVQFDEVGAE